MRKLFIVVVLAGIAYVPLDFVAKGYAEGKLEERVEASAPGQQNPSADIESFPFVARLLVSGDAGDMRIVAVRVPAGPIDFDSFELELQGVRVDRDLLFQRKVKLREIDAGIVRLGVDSPVSVDGVRVPRTALIPCDGEASSDGQRVVVECTFEEVPQVFLDVSSRVSR